MAWHANGPVGVCCTLQTRLCGACRLTDRLTDHGCVQVSERQAAILEERLALALDELAHAKLECAQHSTTL